MSSQEPLTFTTTNFDTEVLASDQPVLVDFWAPWCGPCQALNPVIKNLASEFAGTVKVGKLNVDENGETAARYAVTSIPAVLIFRGGEVVETIVGAQSKARYAEALQGLVSSS